MEIIFGNQRYSMESLKKQILTLSQKVDALYQVIESLDRKLSQGLANCYLDPNGYSHPETDQNEPFSVRIPTGSTRDLEHKDVITDGVFPANNRLHGGDSTITPEVQIQRLTAQLTAAYNRIAALEEQLLRMRIH